MPRLSGGLPPLTLLMGGAALGLLAACNEPLDIDMRNLGGSRTTLDTTTAAQNLPNRPRPDDRGVISYPNYQVVVAQQNDTVRSVATRLGLNADTLGAYNGIAPDAPLRRDEIIALPGRVAEPSPATGAIGTGPILPAGTPSVDVTTLASDAINRAGPQQPVAGNAGMPAAPADAQAANARQTGTEPIRHQVKRGETAYSIARLYNVPVRTVADWNGLGADLAVREGQYLLIPTPGAAAPAPVAAAPTPPGVGSPTPPPPSAAEPLPAERPAPAATPTPPPAAAPNLGAQQTAASASSSLLAYPVRGSIIRAYAKGRNDGIDIGVAAGTDVKAAAAGTVAAVTTDTNGIAIVVVKHPGDLLTVYTNLDNLTVAKGATVRQGQVIGKVRAGSPSFLHFEVRKGLDSVDPTEYLPS